ncbi:MAG: APC family permease [Thermodesulfobacteriota bacterium]
MDHIALIILFIVTGFVFGDGSLPHFYTASASGAASMQSFAESFAVSLIFVAFAYSGWNAAAYLGGEIKNPGRNIPLSLIAGTLVVIILYLLLNALYIYAVPADQMQDVLDVGAKSAVNLFGENISRYFSTAVALAILSVLSAMIMTGPRVYYAMSKDDVFFGLFARVNSRRKTPAASIFLQAAIAILMVITATFNALLVYIGFTLSIFALLTVIGLVRLRYTRPAETPPYKTFGYPLTPLVFILGNLGIVIYAIQSRPLNSLYGLVTIAAGILVYASFAWREKRTGKATSPNPSENRRNLSSPGPKAAPEHQDP